MDEYDALIAAVNAAQMSPCSKSKRGVVVWSPKIGVFSACFNAPPPWFNCDGSDTCRASCSKVAVHAEQAAILDCHKYGKPVNRMEMLHVKVKKKDGMLVAVTSGGPSCPDCSKLIVESGIAGMWLYEDGPDGPRLVRYTAAEFHDLTLKNCGLHPYKKVPECAPSPSSSESPARSATERTPLPASSTSGESTDSPSRTT